LIQITALALASDHFRHGQDVLGKVRVTLGTVRVTLGTVSVMLGTVRVTEARSGLG
jgi:hypothetical protein